MSLIALIAALAMAEPGADALVAQWRSLQSLRADPTRYRLVTEPFTIRDGPLELTVDEGLLVPVFSGHTPNDQQARGQVRMDTWAADGVVPERGEVGTLAFVGFVWVAGNGSIALSWNERADHQTFANHMVRNLGAPRSDLEAVARGEVWTTGATEAVVLSVDPQIQDIFLGPEAEEGDPLDVVVYGEKTRPGALARARAVLEQRQVRLDAAGIDPGLWIAQDRVSVARGRRVLGAHALLDVHLTENLGDVFAARDDQPSGVDWLTLVRDETGVMDTRRQTGVFALDLTNRGEVAWRVTGVPFPPPPDDPEGPPTAPVRMVAEDAYVIVGAHDGGSFALMEIVARMKVRAVGGPVDSFDLHLPRAGSRAAFEVISVTRDDGVSLLSETPLIAHDPVLGPRQPDIGDPDADPSGAPDPSRDGRRPKTLPDDPYHDRIESRLTVIPPEPLQPGEALIFDVRWEDRWALTGVQSFDFRGNGETRTVLYDLGTGSGRKQVLPRLPGAPEGNPSKFRVRMVTQKRRYMVSAASGSVISTSEDDHYVTVESGQVGQRVPFVEVAIGRFIPVDEAAPGFPTIRTKLLDSQFEGVIPEVRRLIRFYEGFMPPYPWPEHEVMQSPGLVNAWVWVAAHELTSTMRTGATSLQAGAALARAHGSSTGQRILAHELAHQWWGHHVRPAHVDDFWFAETFAESLAIMYMGAVRNTYQTAMDDKRTHWESYEDLHIPRASLTDAYGSNAQPDIVYHYGPYVFQQMLRPRIGHEAYHAALDVLQRRYGGQATTTEQLQQTLEVASGQQLDDFFDFWIHGGFVPERLVLTWSASEGRVYGSIESDVPFGSFDVEVDVDGERVWVDVVDGVGHFEIDGPRPTQVQLDPDHRVLAGKRLVVASGTGG